MVAGAPRTVSPSHEIVEEWGRELVEWATEKTPKDEKRIHLKQWWCLVKSLSKNQWDALCELKEFFPYYEKAQIAIAIRYLDGTINPSIAQRFLRLYFPELEKNENDKVKFEVELKKMTEDQVQDLLVKVISYADAKKS